MAEIDYEESSGNVFQDLGFPDAEMHKAKAGIVAKIQEIISQRKLTQTAAASLLGIDQPKISKLLRGEFSGYSLDRLTKFLTALDMDVTIRIKQKPKSHEVAHLVVAA
ncbi:MAG: helix-turn-helix transcriptional regulator [Mariprofundaceae bacterium]|nr:helix-turn-helix transcriptional regulator [Mariprofundaceae bacterium]